MFDFFFSHVAKNFPVETISVKRYVIRKVVALAQDLGIELVRVGKQVSYTLLGINIKESLKDPFAGDVLN